MKKDNLGDRMKGYENNSRYYLIKRTPVIIRLDGKAFHTLTRAMKGFNESFSGIMQKTAMNLVNEIQGCSLIYSQSDEISLLLTDYKTINTCGWFDYNLSKLLSVSAAIASANFSYYFGKVVYFDSRAFNIPQDEVTNYFIWRQQDATRNAIQMLGQQYFSHKELHGVSCNKIQELLFSNHSINFNEYSILQKRGFCIINKLLDLKIPEFSKEREYIEKQVYIRED